MNQNEINAAKNGTDVDDEFQSIKDGINARLKNDDEEEDNGMSDWYKDFLAKRILADTWVKGVMTEVPPLPAGANPFHHDLTNMGTALTRDWMVMHEGFGIPDEKLGHNFFVLINTVTGQRFHIGFTKTETPSNLLPKE